MPSLMPFLPPCFHAPYAAEIMLVYVDCSPPITMMPMMLFAIYDTLYAAARLAGLAIEIEYTSGRALRCRRHCSFF